jgi:monoamine oxidase
MARTPLLFALERLFRDLEIARRRNLPVDVVGEWRARLRSRSAHDPARRRFLAGAAAAGATVSMPALAVARFRRRGPRIAVVGAGLAGLSAALRLQDFGIDATVYEASHRTGGRVLTGPHNYWDEGQISELGGELIDSGHATMLALIDRFRLHKVDVLAAQPEGSQDTYHFLGNYYPQAQAEADFAQVRWALRRDLAVAPYPTTWDGFTPRAQILDDLNVYEWIATRVPGGHNAPLGRLLNAAYTIEFAADTHDQSALNLIYLLGFQPGRDSFAIFGESDERFRIAGGGSGLIRAMTRRLAPRIEPGMVLQRIARTAGGRTLLTFETAGASRTVIADYVILTIPFAVLKDLDLAEAGFDQRKLLAIQNLGAGRSSKVMLQFGERSWNREGPWPGISNGSSYADTGYQSGWDTSRGQGGSSGLLTFFNGGSATASLATEHAFAKANHRGVERDVYTLLRASEPVFPGITSQWNGKAALSQWHRHPLYKTSYSYYTPGSYTRFAGYESVRQGGVLFAGEHTSLEWQGWMEGAAHEGKRAADELLELLGMI